MSIKRLLALILGTTGLLGMVGGVSAQGQTLYWERLDVDLVVEPNSDILVNETWVVTFTSGTFRFAYRNIPMDRVESIELQEVLVDGQALSPGSGSPNTYQTYFEGGDYVIKWYFPPTGPSTHTYVLQYVVQGGLRIYEDGDVIGWKAVFADRDFPVRSSTITVRLPEGAEVQEVATYPEALPATHRVSDPQTVVFSASDIAAGQELEVWVKFPHGIVQGHPPAWQVEEETRPEPEAQRQPVVDTRAQSRWFSNLFALGIGLVLPALSFVGLYLLWYTRGRDRPVRMPAKYLSRPPENLPPGVVGTLIDEQAEVKDIVATIVDLARRGVIRITRGEEKHGLLSAEKDFTFEKMEEPSGLRPFESRLLTRLFDKGNVKKLSELKNQFHTHIPKIQEEMYEETVRLGFFVENPDRTRRRYVVPGVAIAIVAALPLLLVVYFGGSPVLDLNLLTEIGLGITGGLLIVFGRAMPQKTYKGAANTAKWLSFKRYLEGIEQHLRLEQAKEIFDQYLGYAISFGLEHSWVRKFAEAGAPAPGWYQPIYLGESGSGWKAPGQASGARSAHGGGLSSLQKASDSLAISLQSISNDLVIMLNSTGTNLVSKPSSKGGGGIAGVILGGIAGGKGGGGGGGGFG